VEIYTDFQNTCNHWQKFTPGDKHVPLTIRRQRLHNDGVLLAFDGFTTPEQVGRFRNQILYIIKEDAAELPEGEYYFHELVGLAVVDETGSVLG